MNTSPILAADAVPASFASANPSAADSSDFHQVLQQLRPPTTANNGASVNADAPLAETSAPTRTMADAVHADDPAAVLRNFSACAPSTTSGANAGTNSSSAKANFLAAPTTHSQQSGATNVLSAAQVGKEETAGKTVCICAKQNAKEAGTTGTPKTEKARAKSVALNPAAVPIVALSTPAESSVFPNALLAVHSVAKAQQSTSPASDGCVTPFPLKPAATIGHATGEFSAAASGGRPAATSANSATGPALVPEPTMRTASSNAVPSVSSKSIAKPQPAISSGKADRAIGSAAATGDDAASDLRAFNSQAAVDNIMDGNHSALPTGAEPASSHAAPFARTRPQTASQSSSSAQDTPPKGDGVSAANNCDASLSVASAVSAHSSGFQSAAGQSAPAAAAATPDAAFGAHPAAAPPASAGFAPPSQSSAPASAPPQPQVPTHTIPDPLPLVDSGQLRVTANNSELKISVQLPELGKVEVRAVTAHDVTTAHLTAFRHDALPVFAAERTGLEQALKSRDVILGSLDAHAQNSQPQGQSAGQQRQQGSASAQSSDGTASIVTPATLSATTEAGNAGFLPDYSSISVRA